MIINSLPTELFCFETLNCCWDSSTFFHFTFCSKSFTALTLKKLKFPLEQTKKENPTTFFTFTKINLTSELSAVTFVYDPAEVSNVCDYFFCLETWFDSLSNSSTWFASLVQHESTWLTMRMCGIWGKFQMILGNCWKCHAVSIEGKRIN